MKEKYPSLLQLAEQEIFSYKGVATEEDFDYVYKPSDDTYMLLAVLKKQVNFFPKHVCLVEVGTGSGIISVHLAHWMKTAGIQPILHIGIDLNPDASFLSTRYYEQYGMRIQQINTSIFNNIRIQQLKPEIIVFNPPYIPVEEEEIINQHKYLAQKMQLVRQRKPWKREKSNNMIAYSYMGGIDGLMVTRKLLKAIKWRCTTYVIVMEEEGLTQLIDEVGFAQFSEGMQIELMKRQRFHNQLLHVLKIEFKQAP